MANRMTLESMRGGPPSRTGALAGPRTPSKSSSPVKPKDMRPSPNANKYPTLGPTQSLTKIAAAMAGAAVAGSSGAPSAPKSKREALPKIGERADPVEMIVDPNGDKTFGLRATSDPGGFDYAPAGRCLSTSILLERDVMNAAECQFLCTRTPNCVAAQLNHPWRNGKPCALQPPRKTPTDPKCVEGRSECQLFSSCLERVRAPPPMRSDVMHRWGPSWQPEGLKPSQVKWESNATLVIVSYHASLAWLRTLPPHIVDVVVYHKADIGKPNVTYPPMDPKYVLGHLSQQELCRQNATPMSMRRLHHPVVRRSQDSKCPNDCVCGPRLPSEVPKLQYFSVIPNYGMQQKAPYGGSRGMYTRALHACLCDFI